MKTKKSGIAILHDPLWNKGLAFGISERDQLGLRGLLPPVVRTVKMQEAYIMKHIRAQENPIEQNRFLQELHDR